jgi:NADH-quinone oxidoreductase subunit J
MDGSVIGFYVLGALTVIASLGVIGQRNPMYSVMLLIVSFGGLSGLYLLLDAPFSAVTQIIIYAGAIMVLFLFVVMLLNASKEEVARTMSLGPGGMRIAVVLSLVLGIQLLWLLWGVPSSWFAQDPAATSISDVRLIGMRLFKTPTDPSEEWGHVFAFEATSILILVALVGAVVIARRERSS